MEIILFKNVLRFAMRALKNAISTLQWRWSIAECVQKHAEPVPMPAGEIKIIINLTGFNTCQVLKKQP